MFEFEKGSNNFKKGVCFIKPVTDTEFVLPTTLRSEAFRKLSMPDAVLKVRNFVLEGGKARFIVTSDVFAQVVHFNLDDGICLSDEYFDLLPGESREIIVYNVPDGTSYCEIKAECVTVNGMQ